MRTGLRETFRRLKALARGHAIPIERIVPAERPKSIALPDPADWLKLVEPFVKAAGRVDPVEPAHQDEPIVRAEAEKAATLELPEIEQQETIQSAEPLNIMEPAKPAARVKRAVRPNRTVGQAPAIDGASGLIELNDFGSNPGRLRGYQFVPAPAQGAPLVVVLHGCTQTAPAYDHGSGWSELAGRYGFALLFPEQQRINNPNLCFNWFREKDIRRGQGEPLSIRQMITSMIERYALDENRVFITGLSAGGAMTSVLLATYPEMFAGGAIIAGLPYGAATTVPEALERMRGQGHVDDETYAERVRRASKHRGRWPAVSVWQGTDDATVVPMNADAIVGQWRALHEVGEAPDQENVVDGYPHRVWLDERGEVAVEDYRITGMGHGTPLQVEGENGYGAAVPHMLDVGISSTHRIADRWGLLEQVPRPRSIPTRTRPHHVDQPWSRSPQPEPRPASVQATIEAALRSAGLMR